ncbi:hypothetical protein PIB30_085126 [Stylosanthes scabra]|uniref:Uncharacterized protein n=1 Tax=Stylosanthes scabra TaxID=79078 RepID=A0ABU6RT82_9FABA|nr:hypothetical protein [Stylosanthes scabra]
MWIVSQRFWNKRLNKRSSIAANTGRVGLNVTQFEKADFESSGAFQHKGFGYLSGKKEETEKGYLIPQPLLLLTSILLLPPSTSLNLTLLLLPHVGPPRSLVPLGVTAIETRGKKGFELPKPP